MNTRKVKLTDPILATLKFPLIYLFRSCKFKIAASFLGSTPINTHESADSMLEILELNLYRYSKSISFNILPSLLSI